MRKPKNKPRPKTKSCSNCEHFFKNDWRFGCVCEFDMEEYEKKTGRKEPFKNESPRIDKFLCGIDAKYFEPRKERE